MSYYDMALDAGYRGEEARQYAEYLERGEYEHRERQRDEAAQRAYYEEQMRLLVDDGGKTLYGLCGRCQRTVDNYDDGHRVTAITRGGKGVECVARGDIEGWQAAPMGPRPGPTVEALF